MFAVLLVLVAQGFVTGADALVTSKRRQIALPEFKQWVPRYAITRYAGLCSRLYVISVLPVAAAVTLFATAAIGISTVVAWRRGDVLCRREYCAVALILAAIVIRSIP